MRAVPILAPICLVVLCAGAARAAEPGAGVAVLMLKHDPDLVSVQQAEAFREAVRKALGEADLAPLRLDEVDRFLAVADLQCRTTECLTRQAELLNTRMLIGGRVAILKGEKGWGLSLWIYDAERKATLATHARACDGCSEAQALAGTKVVVDKLLEESLRSRGARIMVRSNPTGAQVFVDGEPVGTTDMVYGVTPGMHTVKVRSKKDGVSRTYRVKVGARRQVLVEADLVRGGSKPVSFSGIKAGTWKWVGLGLGLAGLGAGIPLIVLDGMQTCDPAEGYFQCPEQYDTLDIGVGLTVAGAVVLAGAGLLFFLDAAGARDEPEAGARKAGVSPWLGREAGGVTAVLSF